MADIPLAELEYLAGSGAIASLFDELEQDAYNELLRLSPYAVWRRRHVPLIERIKVIRDVQSRIRLKLALAKKKAA